MHKTSADRRSEARCWFAIVALAILVAPLLLTPGVAIAQDATTPDVPAQAAPAQSPPAPVTADPGAAPAGESEPPAMDIATELEDGAVELEPGALPHDLSPWGMFLAADLVVKGVMIGLAFASLVTWTVWLAKSVEIAVARQRLRTVLRDLGSAPTLAGAVSKVAARRGPGADLVRSAADEVNLSVPTLERGEVARDGLKERVSSRLSRLQAQAARGLGRGTGLLATIGATAPFVGLFGTVWGIMNSFIGISEAQTTNLAVVAPGIAEALLATALGLVAAIPAVVFYNLFARSIASYRQALSDAAAALERLVSRDLDFGVTAAISSRGAVLDRTTAGPQDGRLRAAE